jgi:hypothetical protein
MLKALAHGSDLLILGLQHENLERLRAGQPIFIRHGDMPGLRHDVLIVAGATPETILVDLQEKLGLTFPKGTD